MANPFPFSGGAILNASDLNSIGESETDWTPTFSSGVTVGNGTLSGTYQRVNDFVVVQGQFILGSTSAITGDVRVDDPVTASDTYEHAVSITCQFVNVSAVQFVIGAAKRVFGGGILLQYAKQDTTTPAGNSLAALSATAPFTWAVSDRIVWTGVYRVGS